MSVPRPVGNDYTTVTPPTLTSQIDKRSPLVGERAELHSPPPLPPPRSETAAAMVNQL